MLTRKESKEWIEKTCGKGWLILVDEVYDKLPEYLIITQTYQKWGVLKFDTNIDDQDFETFLQSIEDKSSMICEICGESGGEVTVDNWVHTRCEAHSK